jgi:phenol hydroxylase P5 protein
VVEVDLAMVAPDALRFDAGQWVSVPFGPKLVRAYSMASAPGSGRRLSLCADVAPDGLGSRWVRALAVGQEVAFKGPLGGFVFSRADPRRPLFVAEEIGIVPIRSILADLDANGFGREATLVYWARDPGWLVYDGEFRSLARRHPSFSYHPVVGAAAPAWTGALGDLSDSVARVATTVDGMVAYVAGGDAAIKRVREVLVGKGLDRKAVKWEKFW